jgi:hypothetical protein
MSPRRIFEFHQRVAKHIDRRKFFGWSVGLAVPWAMVMQLFIVWHNEVVGQVRPIHLLLRAAVAMAGFGAIVFVVYFKAIRPAVRKARQEEEESA